MIRPDSALAQFELQRDKRHRVFPHKLDDVAAVLDYVAALERVAAFHDALTPAPDPDQTTLPLEEPAK